MKAKVYLETSVVSYLAARPSRDLIVAANQQITHEWWRTRRPEFEVYVSELVIQEASGGDETAAQERLQVLAGIPRLQFHEDVRHLAETLLAAIPLPPKAMVDALHVAFATLNGIDYLLTWNCTHLANATLRPHIERVCREHGYEPPVICTPQELLEE
jgi:predicted nucleic acid-binding protein